MIETKICNKCKKKLPLNHEHDKCEACRNKKINRIKEGCMTVAGLLLAIIFAKTAFFGGKDKE